MGRVNRHPLRRVVDSQVHEGRMGLFTPNGIYTRWYELRLECDHRVERTVRYRYEPGEARHGWARLHRLPPSDRMLPPPQRVRCGLCPVI